MSSCIPNVLNAKSFCNVGELKKLLAEYPDETWVMVNYAPGALYFDESMLTLILEPADEELQNSFDNQIENDPLIF